MDRRNGQFSDFEVTGWLRSCGLLGLCLSFVLLEGCATNGQRERSRRLRERPVQSQPAEESSPEEVTPSSESSEPSAAAFEEEEATESEADRPSLSPSGPQTPDDVLATLGKNRRARQEQAEELVRAAREDRLNFEPVEAEAKLTQALRLDPQNEDAERLLAQVRAELGDGRGEVHQVYRDVVEQIEAGRGQLLAEIQLLINEGQRLEDADNYGQAIEKYEKGLELVRHNTLNLSLREQERFLAGRIEIATRRKKTKDEEERRLQEEKLRDAAELVRTADVKYLKNRLQRLRRRALDAFKNQEYELAEEVAQEILLVYPEDREAKHLKQLARQNRHIKKRHELFLASVENHRRALLGVRESSVLYQEIFRFPPKKEWDRLQPKETSLADVIAETESNVEREIKRKLKSPQSLSFEEDTPFKDALRQLSDINGINIVLNKAAEDFVAGDETTIRLPPVSNLPLENVLGLILTQAQDQDFSFVIRDGAIVVGPGDSLGQTFYLHFYDIFDITQPHPDFPAPPLALESLEGTEGGGGGAVDLGLDLQEEAGAGRIGAEKLQELIEREITEGTEVVGSVKYQQGKLAVRTTFENHARIERLLEELRKATGIMVTVESRFLALQDNFLEEIGVNMGSGTNTFLPNTIPDIDGQGTSISPGYEFFNAQQDVNLRAATIGDFSQPIGSRVNPFNLTPEGGGAYQLNVLTDQYQLEAILTGVAKNQEIKRLSSPRVTAFNTQIAHTLVINQAAFIKDLEVNQTGVVPVVNPRIGVLNTGSILEVRPNVSYDRKYIVLEIQPTLAEALDSEIAVLNLSGNFTVVPVELPVTSVTQIKTTVTIPDGGTVLVGGLKREIKNKSSVGIPGLLHIPGLDLIFGRKGDSVLRSNLFVLINAKITVVQEEETRLFNT